ncbi:MAG TPA: UbiD family decarboxylase domain-containing protein [Pirellulales bacterium]|nr:UbiD family decarboxylase domain-containing protein [Pirellulales bacterium]
MARDSLADFLEELHRGGQLLRVAAEVDPQLEVAAITHRVAQDRGPALLFERVRGHAWPVVTNVLGSEARIALALGLDTLAEAAGRVEQWLAGPDPRTWLERIKDGAAGADKLAPRAIKQAACQQIVQLGRDVDLARLPALRSWPLEPRPVITCGRVCWRDPHALRLAMETLSVEVLAANRLAIGLHGGAALNASLAAASERGLRLPVAVVLGGDPLYALLGPRWPPQWCRLRLAALLRTRPVDIVRCRTQELDVPADADVVIEGYLDPAAALPQENVPLAGPGGYYLSTLSRHEMLVTAVTNRTNPVVPATVVGAGLHEALAIDQALLAMLRPTIAQAVPDLVDYHAPSSAGWNPSLVVSIRKRHPGQAHQVAAALWGLHATATSRVLVIVDEEVDVRDEGQVLRAIGTAAAPRGDVWVHSGPASTFDHASESPGLGTHLAIDATTKLPGEHPRPWPPRVLEDEATRQLLSQRWTEYGLPGGSMAGDKRRPPAAPV